MGVSSGFPQEYESGGDCNFKKENIPSSCPYEIEGQKSGADQEEDGECKNPFKDSVTKCGRKRFFCIVASFCPKGDTCTVDPKLTVTRCTSGLYYDGTPADITPTLKNIGMNSAVEFAWLDTSMNNEKGYRIYKHTNGGTEVSFKNAKDAVLVADVPFGSKGCGSRFEPIAYRDVSTGNKPGIMLVYTIVSSADATDELAGSTPFLVPWLAQFQATVSTESGQPVSDVIVAISRLDSDGSIDERYSSFLSGTTNKMGIYNHEVRVTDKNWYEPLQHFRVTVAKTSEANGKVVVHEFEPASINVTATHLREVEFAFTDMTAVAIQGTVGYVLPSDPKFVSECQERRLKL